MLSLGCFNAEIDLLQNPSLIESFRHANMIGYKDDNGLLKKYLDIVFVHFFEEQLILFPNSKNIIDSWIVTADYLLNEEIKNNCIPITYTPSIKQTIFRC